MVFALAPDVCIVQAVEVFAHAPFGYEEAHRDDAELEGDEVVRPTAAQNFFALQGLHEGTVPWLYLDKKGLVTTAIGVLVDGPQKARVYSFGWKNADGSLASTAQIDAAWNAVKARQDLADVGGGSDEFARLTTIRLGPASAKVGDYTPEIAAIYNKTVAEFEDAFRAVFPLYDAWPSDAQVALMKHAWAGGTPTKAGWPRLVGYLQEDPPDFARAAGEIALRGVDAKYDRDMARMMLNASEVLLSGADPSVFYFPEAP